MADVRRLHLTALDQWECWSSPTIGDAPSDLRIVHQLAVIIVVLVGSPPRAVIAGGFVQVAEDGVELVRWMRLVPRARPEAHRPLEDFMTAGPQVRDGFGLSVNT